MDIVIVNKEVVSYSQYMNNDKIFIKKGIDDGALKLASTIASEEWQPDKVYTMDICLDDGGYHLLEVNSFSCCGLYLCDVKPIISKVSEIALREWEEYQ